MKYQNQTNISKSHTRPVSGTGEWAEKNVNIQGGCNRGCKYCYAARMATLYGRTTPDKWTEPVVDESKVNKRYRKYKGRVMFPSTHDISPENIQDCLQVMDCLLKAGNDILVVSKPELACIKSICARFGGFRKQILFRFTIGSADSAVLKKWEPNASSFNERLRCLRCAHAAGFKTSVSCEPMLDTKIEKIIRAVSPYVTDTIWLGRANMLRQTIGMNCPGDEEVKAMANQLLTEQSDDWIRALYREHKDNPLIHFKDSIKKVVGLARPTEKGLDI
jgi:DNA repair photolyase